MLLFITWTLYALPGLVLGFTLHELAHAVAVVHFGDDTPRHDRRLTVDPLEHIDPVGFALLLAVGFGFAKPVRYNALRIRNRTHQAILAAVGPLTNLVLAAVFGIALRLVVALQPAAPVPDGCGFLTGSAAGPAPGAGDDCLTYVTNGFVPLGHGGATYIACAILYQAVFVNALLFVFNMIPVPPLDGFTVFRGLFWRVIPDVIEWMERNQQLLMFAGIAVILVLPRLTGGTNGLSGSVAWFVTLTAGHNVFYGFLPQGIVSFLSALRA